ncbi:unnamed protein product [Haemonchus placei]|uniref:Uncharacterized protein n=1 Tax=Haemonchus placei TaxID=6290 RepID=A0A0N4WFJ5_HAEPC|nr:unnamed protein product [Haemonchus placei]
MRRSVRRLPRTPEPSPRGHRRVQEVLSDDPLSITCLAETAPSLDEAYLVPTTARNSSKHKIEYDQNFLLEGFV